MRYYNLSIFKTGSTPPAYTFTSHPQGPAGPMDPGALNIEVNAIVGSYGQIYGGGNPSGGADYGSSFIRVWGIPLQLIGQSYNLSLPGGTAGGLPGASWTAALTGGTTRGLPLGNPQAIGTIIQGVIFRAIGNWVGTDMTLDMYLSPLPSTNVQNPQAGGSPNLPNNNFTFHWTKGQPLANVVKAALSTAYPGVPIKISINPALTLDHDVTGTYPTLQTFAQFLNDRSNAILGPGDASYTGVQVWAQNGTINVSDSSQQGTNQPIQATAGTGGVGVKTVTLQQTDLVGQPTWIAANTIQVTTVARGDINMMDNITLPPTLTTVTQAGALNNTNPLGQNRFGTSFNGTIQVQFAHHVLNYKSPQGQAWVTVYDCIVKPGAMTAQVAPPRTPVAALPAPVAVWPAI